MVMVDSRHGQFYMNDKLAEQLQIAKNNLVNDWDIMLIITSGGKPGGGKTTLSSQIATLIDPPFDNSNCLFDSANLEKRAFKIKRRPFAMTYDEAKQALNKKRQMTMVYHQLEMFFDTCRQLNPALILCTPSLFDLPMPLVINRASAVIDVYWRVEEKRRVRGFFRFFGDEAKRKLYLKGAKWQDHWAQEPDFIGEFPDFLTIDRERYRKDKLEAARIQLAGEPSRSFGYADKFKNLITGLLNNKKATTSEIAKYSGLTQRRIQMIHKEQDEEESENEGEAAKANSTLGETT